MTSQSFVANASIGIFVSLRLRTVQRLRNQ